MHLRITAALITVVLAPAFPAAAGQEDPRLDALFEMLRTTQSDSEAQGAEASIWSIWSENGDPETTRLLLKGIAAFNQNDGEGALAAFDDVVRRDARFAEGWNKRATVEYALGEYSASVADIERTLALEPRHFGALSGLGQIYLALDRKNLALKAFRAALTIDPHLAGVRDTVDVLQKELEGDPI